MPAVTVSYPEDRAAERVSDVYSLVDAIVVIDYRVRGNDRDLLDYLNFCTEALGRMQALNDRERALRAIALARISSYLSSQSLDDVLSPGRLNLAGDLRDQVQKAFDDNRTGVEVMAVNLPMLRPSRRSAPSFEEFGIGAQARRQRLAQSDQVVSQMFGAAIGDPVMIESVLAGIADYERLKNEDGPTDPKTLQQREIVEAMLLRSGGIAADVLVNAERDRWVTLLRDRAKISRVRSQLLAYRAAPELYRQREQMNVYKRFLPYLDKYILSIDPSQVHIDMDMKKVPQAFEFAGASKDEMEKQ